MVAAQNMVQTLLGTDNSTKGKNVETTIHHVKQPQLSVRVEIKLSVCTHTVFSLRGEQYRIQKVGFAFLCMEF